MGYEWLMSDFDQAATAAGPAPGFPNLEPKRIKVFGVMHIVFGGMGLLQLLFGVLMAVSGLQEKLLKLSSAASPPGTFELQMEMTERLQTYTWISWGIMCILGVLLLKAGIGLVRKKKESVAASNLYAWTSIGMKVVMLILFFTMALPAFNEMFESLVDSSVAGGKATLMTMRISSAVGGVLGPVLGAIYPILALVMLNKPVVRDFFKVQGQ